MASRRDPKTVSKKSEQNVAHAAARKQNALDQLAAVSAWLAAPPKPKSNKYDYNLEPKVTADKPVRQGRTPGRRIKPSLPSDAS